MNPKLNDYLKQHFNITLTPQQQDAVNALHGPTCVISCPGSGKTTVTVIRLANLITTGQIHPQHILPLTFSKAAASDMNKRFATLFPTLSAHVKFLTIHRFAYQVIRLYEQLHHVKYGFVDQANEPATHAKVILTKLYVELTNTYPSDDDIEMLKTQMSLMKNLMIEPTHEKEIKQYIETDVDVFISLYKAYDDYKERHFLLDYDDILQTAHGILKHDTDIRARITQQYPYVQVDEAQDTSKLQFELIKLVLTDAQNLFLVGDDDQSIYAFRGAYPKQLLEFQKTFPSGHVIYMSENFRSSKNIVTSSANFIAKNKQRYQKEITTQNPPSEDIVFHSFESEKKQLDYLVSVCQKAPQLDEVAILYRQNVSALSLIETFERHHIPFRLSEGKLSFFTHPIVKDIEAMILLAQTPNDAVAFRRVARLLYLPATLIQSVLAVETSSYLKTTVSKGTTLKTYQLDKIRDFNKHLSKLNEMSPSRALGVMLDTLQYRQYLIKKGFLKEEEDASFTQALGVLETLKLIALSQPTLTDFLARLAHLKQVSTQSTKAAAVTLMTFHGSKGLEFDTVLMIDCMNGITPPQTVLAEAAKKKMDAYEEERRLFYVAMTRARVQLELLAVDFKYGMPFAPSEFLVQVHQLVHPKAPSKPKRLSKHLAELKHALLSDLDLTPFEVGTVISHTIFGQGTITALSGEIATIDFESETKRISLRITLENGTLSLI